MAELALEALRLALSPEQIGWLALGVLAGLVVGIIPGLGGLMGMAVLLPFAWGMEPSAGIALLIGMSAVTTTSDTFPAVLLGIPGTSGSQATIVDGYPLARKGQAALALGAGFTASLLGGIIGAAVLFMAIPVAAPFILSFRSPQLFMLAMLGAAMIAVLSRGAPLKGAVSAAAGLLLSTVGVATLTGQTRFTGDIVYLIDGVNLVLLALGLFAVPELVALLTEGKSIARGSKRLSGSVMTGIVATIRNKWLVVRSAIAGAVLGMIPGVGGSVIDWIVYGGTAQFTKKGDPQFGRGDVRGVIAPEAANNAKEGGVLIPTLLFGIPGSATAAVLLGGLVMMGVQVGPRMLAETNQPILLGVIWTLVLGNILATAVCLGLSRPLAKLSLIDARKLAPFLLVIIMVAAYQASGRPGDMLMVLLIAAVSWGMRAGGWPRPPLIIGFVLGPSAENFLWRAVTRYELDWLTWPSTLGIAATAVMIIIAAALASRSDRRSTLVGSSGKGVGDE